MTLGFSYFILRESEGAKGYLLVVGGVKPQPTSGGFFSGFLPKRERGVLEVGGCQSYAPFWMPIIGRHLVCRVPKEGP